LGLPRFGNEMRHEIMPDGRLKLTVDEKEQKELLERRAAAEENRNEEWWDASRIESEVLEPLLANSELHWIPEEATEDLTSAPMLGILDNGPDGIGFRYDDLPERRFGQVCIGSDEDGDYFAAIIARWAFMGYQVRAFLDDLADKGECIWEGGRIT
jgi:hypothetical protein